MEKKILLSFDIEEFEMPREYGDPIPFDEQIQVSREGTIKILNILAKYDIKATFYTTANFARNALDIVNMIVDSGHELASHGFVHDHFKPEHLKMSKDYLESISQQEVIGYRMARMAKFSEEDLFDAGYKYNSSINPTFLPGRYNNLNEPRTYFMRNNVVQLPSSVTPLFRFPLFWLAFHNLPLSIYQQMSKRTINKDGYLNVYFHPWEFMNIGPKAKYNFPFYVTRNVGSNMEKRFEKFIAWGLKNKYTFSRSCDFVSELNLSN